MSKSTWKSFLPTCPCSCPFLMLALPPPFSKWEPWTSQLPPPYSTDIFNQIQNLIECTYKIITNSTAKHLLNWVTCLIPAVSWRKGTLNLSHTLVGWEILSKIEVIWGGRRETPWSEESRAGHTEKRHLDICLKIQCKLGKAGYQGQGDLGNVCTFWSIEVIEYPYTVSMFSLPQH